MDLGLWKYLDCSYNTCFYPTASFMDISFIGHFVILVALHDAHVTASAARSYLMSAYEEF